MKKKLLFSFLIIIIGLFYVNVEALSPPTPYISKSTHTVDEVVTDVDQVVTLNTGESLQLYFYVFVGHDLPTDPLEGSNTIYTIPTADQYSWSVSNNKIATIDSTGKLKALRAGTVTVTVCYDDGIPVPGLSTDCSGKKDIIINLNSSCQSSGSNKFKINFSTNGGDKVDSIIIDPTKTDAFDVSLPTPKRDGYKFDGWFTNTQYKTKISKLSDDYRKITYDEEYENYCPLFLYSGTLQAKWTQTVEVPNTALDSSRIVLIVGLFLLAIGTIVICYNIKTKENQI